VDLKALVEATIDSVIRGFDPDDPGSYERWDPELERVEVSLRNSAAKLDPLLLPSVCAERIRIASEAGKPSVVAERSARFLSEFPATVPSFSWVTSLRLDALHGLGDHEEEVRDGLDAARKPELRGGEYVLLLSSLCRRHPGCLPLDEGLWRKLQRAVADLRAVGYGALSGAAGGPAQLEQAVCRIADELRRVNRERGEALLSATP
jgi:hypothetical protein